MAYRRLHRRDRIITSTANSRISISSKRCMSSVDIMGSIGDNKVADVAIVGGGIVGLATAREIVFRFPRATVAVVEKERNLVTHQTSHNSGVIHAGIYYEPGSNMAKLCVDGASRMYEYCKEKQIPHQRVGKLIVATEESELPVLQNLYERAKANKVQGLEVLNTVKVRELEHNVECIRALHSPNTGIVNYAAVGRSFADDFLSTGRGQIQTRFEVSGIEADEEKGIELHSKRGGRVKANCLITCAGLQSDYVARMAGGAQGPTVLPFRGTYHLLKSEHRHIIKRNIYPVPDPKFPMVGVHLTPRIDGSVLIGPNAALSMAKEGYSFWDVKIKDAIEFAKCKGLWKLVLSNPGIVLQEIWRDVNINAFVAQAQRYCPSLRVEHTSRGWAGVHAVAVDEKGMIMGDFVFENGKSGRVLNVRNAPSPACTSSLAIATAVVDRAVSDFGWTAHNLVGARKEKVVAAEAVAVAAAAAA